MKKILSTSKNKYLLVFILSELQTREDGTGASSEPNIFWYLCRYKRSSVDMIYF